MNRLIIVILLILLCSVSTAVAVENTLPTDPCTAAMSMGTWEATIGEDVCMPVIGAVSAYSGQTAVITALNLPAGYTFTQAPADINVVGFVMPNGVFIDSELAYIASWPNGVVYGRGYFKGKATAAMVWTITFTVTSKSGAKHSEMKQFIVKEKEPLLVTP